MTEREALNLALEALELSHPRFGIGTAIHIKAVAVIKEALAQQALDRKAENARELGLDYDPENTLHWHALNYRTAPVQNAQSMFEALEKFVAQRTWVGLTDEEIKSQWSVFWEADCHPWAIDFARAIEAKLKEKNT